MQHCNIAQSMRQSAADQVSQHGRVATGPSRNRLPPNAAAAGRPASASPAALAAGHRFLTDEEESSSDSDAAASAHAEGRSNGSRQQKPHQHTSASLPSQHLPVSSAAGSSALERKPGASGRSGSAPAASGAVPAVAAPVSYYMPVVDTPSLLDMETSIPSLQNGSLLSATAQLNILLPAPLGEVSNI